jgi:hypothetical protein
MDIIKIIAELRNERAAIDETLAVLERLAHTRGKRPGRPPGWLSVVQEDRGALVERKTRSFSADTKKRMAEAQKKRWAAYRKAQQTQAATK